MICINVNNYVEQLLSPIEMFAYPEGSIFQQYSAGEPQDWYYVNCGKGEPLLTIWSSEGVYKLSHENSKDCKQLMDHVKVKKVDMVLNITLEKI